MCTVRSTREQKYMNTESRTQATHTQTSTVTEIDVERLLETELTSMKTTRIQLRSFQL